MAALCPVVPKNTRVEVEELVRKEIWGVGPGFLSAPPPTEHCSVHCTNSCVLAYVEE